MGKMSLRLDEPSCWTSKAKIRQHWKCSWNSLCAWMCVYECVCAFWRLGFVNSPSAGWDEAFNVCFTPVFHLCLVLTHSCLAVPGCAKAALEVSVCICAAVCVCVYVCVSVVCALGVVSHVLLFCMSWAKHKSVFRWQNFILKHTNTHSTYH